MYIHPDFKALKIIPIDNYKLIKTFENSLKEWKFWEIGTFQFMLMYGT